MASDHWCVHAFGLCAYCKCRYSSRFDFGIYFSPLLDAAPSHDKDSGAGLLEGCWCSTIMKNWIGLLLYTHKYLFKLCSSIDCDVQKQMQMFVCKEYTSPVTFINKQKSVIVIIHISALSFLLRKQFFIFFVICYWHFDLMGSCSNLIVDWSFCMQKHFCFLWYTIYLHKICISILVPERAVSWPVIFKEMSKRLSFNHRSHLSRHGW